MGKLKLKRLLGKRKPLYKTLEALQSIEEGPFWVECPEGTVLFGEAHDVAFSVPISGGEDVLGHLKSTRSLESVGVIVENFVKLEIERRDITHEALERYRELSLLYDLAERLMQCDDISEIGAVVLQESQKVASCDLGFLWSYSGPENVGGGRGRAVAQSGDEGANASCPLLEQVGATGQAAIVEDAGEESGIRSWVAAPVKGDGGVWGALVLGSAQVSAYDSGTLKLVNSLAGQVAPLIESARLAQQQRELARSFARFVPDEFLGALERTNVADIGPGEAAEKEMSVLFSDIRAFTTLVEGKSPDESYSFINEYLSHIEPGVREYGGFLGEVIGDAIVALFNDGGADNAVRAAITCEQALNRYNSGRKDAGELEVHMGMGITTGSLMLGTIGAPERIKCSVIGDAVNTAARIEGLTKIYGAKILISNITRNQLEDPDKYLMRPVDKVRAVGKNLPITLYEILDVIPDAELEARLQARMDFEEGWRLYQDGKPGDALVAFASALRVDPGDSLTRLFLGRCWQFLEYGMPDDWDGVTQMRTK